MDTTDAERPSTPEPDGPSDKALLHRLGALLNRVDPVPPDLLDAAQATFSLRHLDAELAELTFDSAVDQPEFALRSDDGPRLLTFETAGLTVELQVDDDAGRLLGRLEPPAPGRVEVRDGSGRIVVTAPADDAGRFVVAPVPSGAVQLRCHRAGARPVATSWSRLA